MPPPPAFDSTAPTPALILAGGRARRMGGGDKPLLALDGGTTMLARIIAALGVRPIAISANGDPARFARFGCPVLDDGPFVGEGPLAGVLAGLDWAAGLGAAALLTVPGDSPFLPSDLDHRLAPPPSCAASAGRPHHLTALWPVTCRDALRRWLAVPGPRHVGRFAASIGMRAAEFPMLSCDPFFNVNTPDDLATARTLASQRGTEKPE